MRAFRILEEQHIEYMVESSMEKALKSTKRDMIANILHGFQSCWRYPVRDREEAEEGVC